ncbi:MdlB ABC-type multidrug transport system, ATPase and permease components [Candidatus Nanopelagicaceae bacterium]
MLGGSNFGRSIRNMNLSPSVIRKTLANSVLGRSISLLTQSDRRKILAVVVLQILMALLDLIGVAVIGVLGALAVNGVQSKQPGNRVSAALNLLGLDGYSFQEQAAILGLAAATILIGRTIFSIIFTKRTLLFLSRRGAVISSTLISRLLAKSLLAVQERTTQQTLYSVTQGVRVITLGVLASAVSLIADAAILIVMAAGLFVVDPSIAISSFLVFALIGFALYKLMHEKARTLGIQESEYTVQSSEKIVEVLNSYREAIVRNRREFYAREIGNIRMQLADTLAEVSFLPSVSKYIVETTVVIGALLISAVQFYLQDASHAVATLAVFLAAGSRIAPAVLRVQQSSISIRGSLGAATPTLDLIDFLGSETSPEPVNDFVSIDHDGFNSTVELNNVSFSYPDAHKQAVSGATLLVSAGQSVAIVGGSGAGKTSLVDLLLGVLTADSGEVKISGYPPLVTISKWPGAISYVPQDVAISNGTVRDNVALGFSRQYVDDNLVWEALEIAQLSEHVRELPNGLDTEVGERGTKLSGGQRQRLGIARAMFTRPKMLVLDEATSSLDGQTEFDISTAISNLRGTVTVIMIAHRLSTVRHADQIAYLRDGQILATGTFDEVRGLIPDFDHQAGLMGL